MFNKKKAPIVSVVPTTRVVSQFMPLESFFCEDMKSAYVKDMKYSLREGNVKLAAKIEEWKENSLVQEI